MPNSQSTFHPILLSEREAAIYLSISVSTIRRWRYAGTGPEYFSYGDIIRYRKECLDAFVLSHSTIPQTMSAA